jgi:hypothetical protein
LIVGAHSQKKNHVLSLGFDKLQLPPFLFLRIAGIWKGTKKKFASNNVLFHIVIEKTNFFFKLNYRGKHTPKNTIFHMKKKKNFNKFLSRETLGEIKLPLHYYDVLSNVS